MVKDGDGLAVPERPAGVGQHFLGKIERAARTVEDGGRRADTAMPAVVEKARQRRGIAAQHRRRHQTRGIGLHRGDQGGDEPRRRQRRVPLQIDHDLVHAAEIRRHDGAALGAVAAGVRRHGDLGSEGARGIGDAGIVGGDDDPVHALGGYGGIPAAPDQATRLAAGAPQLDERLAGVAAGGVARRNDEQHRHGVVRPEAG